VSRLGFSSCVCSPLLETFSISARKEGRAIKQDHVTKEEEFKEQIQTWVMFEASWSKEDGPTHFWTFLVVTKGPEKATKGGENGSQSKFLTEFGLCPKINPKPLSSNPIKAV
jgi:hypothetical protein